MQNNLEHEGRWDYRNPENPNLPHILAAGYMESSQASSSVAHPDSTFDFEAEKKRAFEAYLKRREHDEGDTYAATLLNAANRAGFDIKAVGKRVPKLKAEELSSPTQFQLPIVFTSADPGSTYPNEESSTPLTFSVLTPPLPKPHVASPGSAQDDSGKNTVENRVLTSGGSEAATAKGEMNGGSRNEKKIKGSDGGGGFGSWLMSWIPFVSRKKASPAKPKNKTQVNAKYTSAGHDLTASSSRKSYESYSSGSESAGENSWAREQQEDGKKMLEGGFAAYAAERNAPPGLGKSAQGSSSSQFTQPAHIQSHPGTHPAPTLYPNPKTYPQQQTGQHILLNRANGQYAQNSFGPGLVGSSMMGMGGGSSSGGGRQQRVGMLEGGISGGGGGGGPVGPYSYGGYQAGQGGPAYSNGQTYGGLDGYNMAPTPTTQTNISTTHHNQITYSPPPPIAHLAYSLNPAEAQLIAAQTPNGSYGYYRHGYGGYSQVDGQVQEQMDMDMQVETQMQMQGQGQGQRQGKGQAYRGVGGGMQGQGLEQRQMQMQMQGQGQGYGGGGGGGVAGYEMGRGDYEVGNENYGNGGGRFGSRGGMY